MNVEAICCGYSKYFNHLIQIKIGNNTGDTEDL